MKQIPNGYVETSPGVFTKLKPKDRATRLPDPQSKSALRSALESVPERTTTRQGRITVRITSYRCRLCDPDNCIAGCKALIDQLRYAGLIPDDRPEDIKLESEQVRVKHQEAQKTVIDLVYG